VGEDLGVAAVVVVPRLPAGGECSRSLRVVSVTDDWKRGEPAS
jgi:hypothetical protein